MSSHAKNAPTAFFHGASACLVWYCTEPRNTKVHEKESNVQDPEGSSLPQKKGVFKSHMQHELSHDKEPSSKRI